MIIGIDGNEANVHRRVGISEYAFELLTQFSSLKFNPSASFRTGIQNSKFSIYLKENPLKNLPEETLDWNYRVLKPGKFWTQWRLPLDLYLTRPKPSVFFSPTHYAPRFSPVPTVVSIMDLSFLFYPELFKKSDLYQLTNWTAYSVKKAKKVFTISKSTKNDIIKAYNVPEEKVVVTYLGIKDTVSLQPHVYGMNQLKAKYHISDNYILFVGTLQPRKNISRLIEAFSKIESGIRNHPSASLRTGESGIKELELVVIGKKGWLYEEILEAPKKFGIEAKVKFLHNVSDEDLSIFYKHALVYVLPSLYEGFGLPVLEAMKHDCPVITSNISSLPEAGGDAAIYVDPEDVEDIADKIVKVITNDNLRHEMIEKGKKHVTKFSWEKTAKQTLEVLEGIGETS